MKRKNLDGENLKRETGQEQALEGLEVIQSLQQEAVAPQKQGIGNNNKRKAMELEEALSQDHRTRPRCSGLTVIQNKVFLPLSEFREDQMYADQPPP